MTGRYPQRTGLPAVTYPHDRRGLPSDERAVADVLRDSGYRTGSFGEWHLGDPAQRPELSPLRHGFDRYVGLPYSQRRYTDAAIAFLREPRDKPFFVYLPHSSPHRPFYLAQRGGGRSRGGLYGDAVQEADHHVGRVLDELTRLGLAENTLVVVTSDNGPWFKGTTGGLRSRKGTTFEGGVRVPFFARWPAPVALSPANLVRRRPALAGRCHRGADAGGPAARRCRPRVRVAGRIRAQRSDLPLQRVVAQRRALRAVEAAPVAAPAPRSAGHALLFNIDRDRVETHDVAASHPKIVGRLSALADRFDQEIAAQRPEAERRARGLR
jgi:arylsulfatase A-like enzyme